jgi:hypothetical protein
VCPSGPAPVPACGMSTTSTSSYPNSWTINQPLDRQHYTNTCVPNSSVYILQAAGAASGSVTELGLGGEENTKKTGTWVGNAAPVMNKHAPHSYNGWIYEQPGDVNTYMDYVVSDVYDYGQTMMNAMSPNPTGGNHPTVFFWSGYGADNHANISYGYQFSGGGYVYIADDYDPTWGSLHAPYGHWKVPLAQVWAAIHSKQNGPEIVW